MGRLLAAVYDRFNAKAEKACLRAWRADLLRGISGRVLEVGAGTGANLPHYPRDLERLVLAEPDRHMRRKLVRQVDALGWTRAEVLDATSEEIPLPDAGVDVVVGTLVLCSVPRVDRALAEIRRVLRPEGQFVFIEHVAAENRPRRLKWQHRLEPIWQRIAGNCHLTRRTEAAIARAGFTITQITRESMRKAMPIVRPTIRGVAIRA